MYFLHHISIIMHVSNKQIFYPFLGRFFTNEYERYKHEECLQRFCGKAVERTPRLSIDSILRMYAEQKKKLGYESDSISFVPVELAEDIRYHTQDWPREFSFQWLNPEHTKLRITHYNDMPSNTKDIEVVYEPTPDKKWKQWFFVCPKLWHKVKHLYMDDLYDITRIASKEAKKLWYVNQFLTPHQRQKRPDELYNKLKQYWPALLGELYPYIRRLEDDYEFLETLGTQYQIKLYKRIIAYIRDTRAWELRSPRRYTERKSKEEKELAEYERLHKEYQEHMDYIDSMTRYFKDNPV